jgi:hypothetical protein
MKRIAALVLVLAVTLTGCVSAKKKSAARKPPPLPPLPPGLVLKTNTTATIAIVPSVVSPSYAPGDFALISVKTQAGNKVVLTWQNGTPPFQPQSKPDVLSPWADYGPSTNQRSITNPAPYNFTKAFFGVKSSAMMPGLLTWLKNTPADRACVVNALKTDHSGNVIVTGSFYPPNVDLGGIVITTTGDADAFLAKYNAQGVIQWAHAIGGTGPDFGKSIALDNSDNIAISGELGSFSMTVGAQTITNHSLMSDIFVAKYTPNGAPIWLRGYGGVATDFAAGIAMDANGHVYSASQSGNVVEFSDDIKLTGFGGFDIALAKFSAVNGTTLWAKLRGGADQDYVNALAVDAAGDVVITGDTRGDLGGGPNLGGFYVAKYSGLDGRYLLSRVSPGGNGYGITFGPTGNIIVTGRCAGTTDFGGGPIAPTSPSKLFVVSYTPAINYQWATGFGSGSDIGYGVTVDSEMLAITGQVYGGLSFGGPFRVGNGSANGFLAAFNLSGNSPPAYRWDTRYAGGVSGGNSIMLDGLGHVVNGGYASGNVNIGGVVVVGAGSVGAAWTAQFAK